MAYSEVIKNFNRIRDYMREFYVYGFKSRDEYTKKSGRSYDDERRRLESWLGDHMRFRQTADGKNVFISIDSRVLHHNPLYKAWKAKSFTDGDITLHFILMDVLNGSEKPLSIVEIAERTDEYLSEFDEPKTFDESTIRKKLKEYEAEGIVRSEKQGKTVLYSSVEKDKLPDSTLLDFFSEVAPCGVIGAYLLDKVGRHDELFAFKHHYITSAMDSEILCDLFEAMHEKRNITLEVTHRNREKIVENHVVPLKVMISVQNGRQYLMAYSPRFKRITPIRLDNILSVKMGEESEMFDSMRRTFKRILPHIWGVSTQARSGKHMEHVEFTIRYGKSEWHIPKRLMREKRCGTVTKIDRNTSKFSADVYDAGELVPWIRTFICRIIEISFSDKELEKQFKDDLKEMYDMYLTEGGEKYDLQ